MTAADIPKTAVIMPFGLYIYFAVYFGYTIHMWGQTMQLQVFLFRFTSVNSFQGIDLLKLAQLRKEDIDLQHKLSSTTLELCIKQIETSKETLLCDTSTIEDRPIDAMSPNSCINVPNFWGFGAISTDIEKFSNIYRSFHQSLVTFWENPSLFIDQTA